MKEVVIILPRVGNDGEDLTGAVDRIKAQLAARYGGYYAVTGEGAYCPLDGSPQIEPVEIITVAMEPDGRDQIDFITLSVRAKTLLKQKKLYVRFGDGDAEIV